MIKIEKLNELTLKVICDKSIAMEIYDKFSFQVPGYQYTPQYKHGRWDGFIHLFNLKSYTLPLGLLVYLLKMTRDNQWTIEIDKSLKLDDFDLEIEKFVEKVLPNLILEPYDYQLETFIKSIKLNRSLILSPTRITENPSLSISLFVFFLIKHQERY